MAQRFPETLVRATALIGDERTAMMADAIRTTFGMRASRFAINQIAISSDEALSAWLALYATLVADSAIGRSHRDYAGDIARDGPAHHPARIGIDGACLPS